MVCVMMVVTGTAAVVGDNCAAGTPRASVHSAARHGAGGKQPPRSRVHELSD